MMQSQDIQTGDIYRLNGTDITFRVTKVFVKEGVVECIQTQTGGTYRYPASQFNVATKVKEPFPPQPFDRRVIP